MSLNLETKPGLPRLIQTKPNQCQFLFKLWSQSVYFLKHNYFGETQVYARAAPTILTMQLEFPKLKIYSKVLSKWRTLKKWLSLLEIELAAWVQFQEKHLFS